MTDLKVLLCPAGSAGDVHPFVGLGRALQGRGHDVTILTSAYFEGLIRRVGLGFSPVGDAESFEKVIQDRGIWHPHTGFLRLLRYVLPGIRGGYRVLEGLWEPGRTVIGAQLLAFGARIFAEKHGVPLATIHLQPMAFLSVAHPPHSLPWLNERSPRPVRELFGWLADASGALALGPSINGLRREVGLPPARRLLTRWVHSPDRIIGLFPEWYASPDPDWPPQARLTGFPLYDEADVTPPPPDLESFLDGSDPPIVFTPGSANLFAAGFFRAAVEACERLGRRGVLLTRHAEQVPRSLPPSVRHFGYAPFSLLLPRAAALVHHGGIGTVAQGLAAGIPQLVMPLSYDQPDNAVRLQELGVGKALPPKRFTGANCARALEELLASEEVRRRCAALAAKTREGDPLAETCDLIEALGATS